MSSTSSTHRPGFDQAKLDAEGDIVADALRDQLLTALDERLRDMASRKSHDEGDNPFESGDDDRAAMLQVRKHLKEISRSMQAELARNFQPDRAQQDMQSTIDISFEDLSLQNPESLDESIAITNVGNRAELLYEHQLWDLRQRMEWWSQQRFPRVSDRSLSPYSICQAFVHAIRPLGIPRDLRLPMFWQFDRHVMRKLHEVYEDLIDTLDRHGFKPLYASKPVQPTAAAAPDDGQTQPTQQTAASPDTTVSQTSDPGSGQGGEGPGFNASSPMPQLDPRTWDALRQLAQQSPPSPGSNPAGTTARRAGPGRHHDATTGAGGSGQGAGPQGAKAPYLDEHLAQDLASLLQGHQRPGWNENQAEDLGARMSAVGRAFNRIITDPHVSRSIKAEFDNLRFAVIKAAMADADFFRDPAHPVRTLFNELGRLVATSRLYGQDELTRIADLLSTIQTQFAPDASRVRDTLRGQTAVSGPDLDAFLNEQIREQAARRRMLIEKSRRVVNEELWLQTAARHCPDDLREALAASWEPMMALRLLRHGVNSELWKQGIGLLRRIVDLVDPPSEIAPDESDQTALISDFTDALRSVGMVSNRVNQLQEKLRSALQAAIALRGSQTPSDDQAATSEPQTTSECLNTALDGETWFEVYDHASDTVLWLRPGGYDQSRRRIRFVDAAGHRQLNIPEAVFIDDLRRGLSAAVNPTPRGRIALECLMVPDDKV